MGRLTEFEDSSRINSAKHAHHEEGLSTQECFKQQTLSFVKVFREMGDPFLTDTEEPLTLDSHDVLNDSDIIIYPHH